METILSPIEVRILGSLIEKSLATPEYYPLSLNALINACNQKSNRDPVVSYDEPTVQGALDDLEQRGLVSKSLAGRVPKFEERFTAQRNLVPRESAVFCVLFLRGPQTPGMIRGRTSRLHHFQTLEELHETLSDLEQGGDIRRLPRLPGHKESRYVHLLSGEPEETPLESTPTPPQGSPVDPERLEKIEQEVETLRNDLEELKREVQVFKKQFE
jgi:uncharacterized protein YceH (UPF0502 family)